MAAARFLLPELAREFMLAGNARLTLKSIMTSKHYTYRIRKKDEDFWFVSVLTQGDNDTGYTYLGIITKHGYFLGRKSDFTQSSKCHVAFNWFWQHLARGRIPEQLEVWHEGRCGRCGRTLTVPESIESGFGPECRAVRRQAA